MKSIAVNCRVVMLLFILSGLVAAEKADGLEDVPHGVGTWPGAGLGNHRACVYVTEPGDAVRVRIPWRRRDALPEKKAIVVIDATTGERIKNVFPVQIHREFGELTALRYGLSLKLSDRPCQHFRTSARARILLRWRSSGARLILCQFCKSFLTSM